MDKLLVVDDNPDNLELVSSMLETQGIESDRVTSGAEALVKMEKHPYPIIISDLMMPVMDGIQLLEKIKRSWPQTEVLIVTAHGSIKTGVEAIRKGAYDYILKPFDMDELLNTVNKVNNEISLRTENKALKKELERIKHSSVIIGETPQIKKIYELIDTVADTNATVLILGESGTGKELAANAIHNGSGRKHGPFVKLACSALAESLLESELFGHEKGSFTGATTQRMGRFEQADGGTLFLDEIGEVSPAVQVKLLRFLQEHEFERVGGTKTIKSNVRIITATNRDLAEEVKDGNFREDLYYRLNVITVKMPSLKERVDDIPSLTNYFIEKYRMEVNRAIDGISDEAVELLKNYDWPGNIRELQNVIERAVVLVKGNQIEVSDLPSNISSAKTRVAGVASSVIPPLKDAKHEFEKEYLINALFANGGNISKTAEMIKLARKNLQDKIKSYGIDVISITGK